MVRDIAKILICSLLCALPAAGAWADGAVYAMTNALGNNQILVYHRSANGNLSPTMPIQTAATGGGGSGLQLAAVDSLGSQGAFSSIPTIAFCLPSTRKARQKIMVPGRTTQTANKARSPRLSSNPTAP